MTIKSITSRDNPQYKELKLLAASSQARRKAGRTLLDGVHLCEAYLQLVGPPVLCIFSDQAQAHPEAAAVIERCLRLHAAGLMLPAALFHALSQVAHGIDLLFVIETPHPAEPQTIGRDAVLLDGVQDPGNFGSILRSAAAAGIREVYCGQGTVFAWSPKVLRAGMGAHFVLDIFENVDLGKIIAASSVPVLATSSHGQHTLYETDLRRPLAWIFGNEGQGVSKRLLAHAGGTVAVPHAGQIESLNVAACAAVCFFEQLRQRRRPSA